MPHVVMYTTAICPYCYRAKSLLDHKGVDYEEIRIDGDPDRFQEMQQRSRRNTVPQIFIGEFHVGGYDDMAALDAAGQLNAKLGLPEEA